MVHYNISTDSGIYIITNILNGKMYIGQAQSIKIRWQRHKTKLRKNYHENKHLQRAWNKYGESVFRFRILESCPIGNLDKREQFYLNAYFPSGMLYNIAIDASSNQRGLKASAETRLKLSKAHKGRKFTIEHRRKIGAAHKNKIVSIETRERIGKASTGRVHSEATRLKISKSSKGHQVSEKQRQVTIERNKTRIISDDMRRKISIAHKGNKHCLGRKLSEETRSKISNSLKGKHPTEETRRKMSEAQKKRNAAKRAKALDNDVGE